MTARTEVNIVDNDEKSILDKAMYNCITPEDNKVVELLKSHGANTAAEMKADKPAPLQAPYDQSSLK